MPTYVSDGVVPAVEDSPIYSYEHNRHSVFGDKTRTPSAGSMLARCRRRRTSIEPSLNQHFLFALRCHHTVSSQLKIV